MDQRIRARYESGPWSARTGATREWTLEVEEDGLSGRIGAGRVLPDAVLSVAGTGIPVDGQRAAELSRRVLAAVTDWQIRFEAIVQVGFARQVATASDLSEGRVTFTLHEIGEEAGHQRLFQTLLPDLGDERLSAGVRRRRRRAALVLLALVQRFPAVLYALALTGEEILEQFQRRAADDLGCDPYVRQVYEFHLAEESNHVSFVRAVYAEAWARAGRMERVLVRRALPRMITGLVDSTVPAEVYLRAGFTRHDVRLIRTSTPRARCRSEVARPVLTALVEAGVFRERCVPRTWRRLVGD